MSDGLKPYPAYAESGVPWLGSIPAGWSAMRARYLLQEIDKRSQDGSELHLSMSQELGLVPASQVERSTLVSESYAGGKLCQPEDLVLNRLKAHLGVFARAKNAGVVSPDYTVLRAEPTANIRYLELTLRSSACRSELRARAKGIVEGFWRLYTDDLFDMRLPVPPLEEQVLIVRYLECMNRRIRRFINGKRNLMALLDEQRESVINAAVTHGPDSRVRLMSSDSQLSGEVPEHWRIARLRSLTRRIDQGVSPQAEAGLAEPGAWGVLKSGCVNRGVFRDTEHKRLPDGFRFDPSLAVREGDVLVSRACGSPRYVGSVGQVLTLRYSLILSDKTFRLVFKDERLASFVTAAMNSRYYRSQVEQVISGAGGLANNLPLSSLKNIQLLVPPGEEAEGIASQLNEKLAKIDETRHRTEREVELLKEYGSRLVADVVTGRIDVRDEAARLPDEDDALAYLTEAGYEADGRGEVTEGDRSSYLEEVEA